jgi:hypothetical protein
LQIFEAIEVAKFEWLKAINPITREVVWTSRNSAPQTTGEIRVAHQKISFMPS